MFETSTSHTRHLQTTLRPLHHVALQKWTARHQWTPNLVVLWSATWHLQWAQAENGFLWQMIYRVPSMLKYKYYLSLASNSLMWCTRCDNNICKLDCAGSTTIWAWTTNFLHHVAPQVLPFTLSVLHIFLVEPVNDLILIPK